MIIQEGKNWTTENFYLIFWRIAMHLRHVLGAKEECDPLSRWTAVVWLVISTGTNNPQKWWCWLTSLITCSLLTTFVMKLVEAWQLPHGYPHPTKQIKMYTKEENSQTTKACTLMAASLQASSSTGTSKSMKNQKKQHTFLHGHWASWAFTQFIHEINCLFNL